MSLLWWILPIYDLKSMCLSRKKFIPYYIYSPSVFENKKSTMVTGYMSQMTNAMCQVTYIYIYIFLPNFFFFFFLLSSSFITNYFIYWNKLDIPNTDLLLGPNFAMKSIHGRAYKKENFMCSDFLLMLS